MTTHCSLTLDLMDAAGFHMRPAALLVKLARQFTSEITLRRGNETANAKSMLSLLVLCGDGCARVSILARGHDARQALQAISQSFPAAAPMPPQGI